MEAAFIYKNLYPNNSFRDTLNIFFAKYSPELTHYLCLKIFQCWGVNECTIKAEISDEEIALFLDQLTDLVAAAHIEHQANRVSDRNAKEDSND